MATDLQQLIFSRTFSPQEISDKTREIYDQVLRESRHLDAGNFRVIHPHDLHVLFDKYDEVFLDGSCRRKLKDTPLTFRLSKRMTQAGGQTTRKQYREPGGKVKTEYEIAVAVTLLFHTFKADQRPVVMSGIPCRDRLEALQRVMEHEMVHLIEMLIWRRSSCCAARFQGIAHRFFGHTEHRHQLITPRETALTQFGIKPGDRVSFRMDGRHYQGFVKRITKRATVLVEDAHGRRYSDGKRYSKFYVPVPLLKLDDK